jgi:RNA polymerase sigma factor (sigma-70 family)
MFIKVNRQDLNTNTQYDLNDLWSQIREGDPDSLSKLFCRSYSWLYKYGFKIVPSNAFVKDAIQELFLNLWKKRSDINEAHSVKSYLFSSLRRIIFRRLQKKRNRTERNHTYGKNLFNDIFNTEELMIHFETNKEKKQQLELAIGSLSKRQREVIYLKFYNGLSTTEIAQVMEINKQSVYNHVSKAINKLQDYVQV